MDSITDIHVETTSKGFLVDINATTDDIARVGEFRMVLNREQIQELIKQLTKALEMDDAEQS